MRQRFTASPYTRGNRTMTKSGPRTRAPEFEARSGDLLLHENKSRRTEEWIRRTTYRRVSAARIETTTLEEVSTCIEIRDA